MGARRSPVLCVDLAPDLVEALRCADSEFQFLDVDGHSLLALGVRIASVQPSIILVAGQWLSAKGLGILLELHELKHDLAVAVVEKDVDISMIPVGIGLGLRGAIDPDSSVEAMIEALGRIRAGEVWLHRDQLVEALRLVISGSLKNDVAILSRLPRLTEREHAALDQLMEGRSNQDIADALGISVETVKVHLKHIYSKLGIHRRAELLSARLGTQRSDLV